MTGVQPAPAGGTSPTADPEPSARRPGWFLVALFAVVAVAAAVRITYALVAVAGEPIGGDPAFYHHGANLLADGEGFVVPVDLIERGVRTEAADHPPLYLSYLALWSAVGLDSIEAHLVASALLGTVAVGLVGLLGRRVAGPAVGVVAAGFAAVYPNLFGWDAMLLSEPAATVTVLTVALLAYRYRDRPALGAAIALGAVTGLAGLARAELLALSVLVVVPVVLGRRRRDVRERLGHLVVAGLACVAVISPWVVHNLTRFEEPVTLSTGFELTLAYSNCDQVYGGSLIGYWNFHCGVAATDAIPGYSGKDQSERNEAFRERALGYADDHLEQVPAVVAARVGRVLGVFRPGQQVDLDSQIEGRDRWVAVAGLWSYWLLAAASVAGFVLLGRRGVARYPLVAPMVTVVLAAASTFGATRYRAAAEPMLCVLAAVAVVAVVGHLAGRRRPAEPA